MNKEIFIKNSFCNVDNLQIILNNYISNYNLHIKYKKYIENNENEKNKENKEDLDNLDDLDDWIDCDDILLYNKAYKEVMYIKNNCNIIHMFYNYMWKDNIKCIENKFIKEQCKTRQEYLFYKYYEELLCEL